MRRAIPLLLVSLMLVGCSTGQTTSGAGTGYVAADGSTVIVAAQDRVKAPAVAGLPTLAGQPLDAAAIDGKVVALNVWASWCAPCRTEAPVLEQVHKDLADEGLVVVGVNTRDDDDAARAFVDRFDITFPSVIDRDGGELLLGFNNVVSRIYTPTTIVLDRQGRIAAWALGEVDESRMRALVEPILAEGN